MLGDPLNFPYVEGDCAVAYSVCKYTELCGIVFDFIVDFGKSFLNCKDIFKGFCVFEQFCERLTFGLEC